MCVRRYCTTCRGNPTGSAPRGVASIRMLTTVWREISEGFNIRGFRDSIPIREYLTRDLFWITRGVVSTHGPDQLLYLARLAGDGLAGDSALVLSSSFLLSLTGPFSKDAEDRADLISFSALVSYLSLPSNFNKQGTSRPP